MVDSDDEYDRKRRDKFRGERSTGDNYRSDRRDERRGREDWLERGRGRSDYYRSGVRERYSPGRDLPPAKRMRSDWNEDNRSRYAAHDPYGMYSWGHDHYPLHGMHNFGGHASMSNIHNRETQINSEMQTQPPMLTLKQFLDTQDDGISDSEVLRKYSEYKLEFKRQQLNEFFVAHKDEEWFKNKYHPEESSNRKKEQLNFLKKRVEVFYELLEKGIITSVSVDVNQTDQLLRLLDTVVIKLEGGTDEDLKVLDEKINDTIRNFESSNKNIKEQDDDVIITDFKPKIKQEKELNWEPIPSKINKTKNSNVDNNEENWDVNDNESINKENKSDEDVGENWNSPKNEKSYNRENYVDDIKEEDWTSIPSKIKNNKSNDKDDEDNWDDNNESISNQEENKKYDWTAKNDKNLSDNKITSPPRKRRTHSESSTSSEVSKREREQSAERHESVSQIDNETKNEEEVDKDDLKEEKKISEDHESSSTNEIINKEELMNDDKTIDLEKEININPANKPRALHRTSSIFLRNLAPAITKSEIEVICKRYDGYLRVAIADPLPERRWYRRGWVTFQRDVNIKEICWNLNNIRLRDCEMGAIVNRDLSRRVRPVNGITAHKTIVRSDIKLIAKIVLNLDEKFNLWGEKKNDGEDNINIVGKEKSFGFKSQNPVLQNITDYLIEEASAEEDELLGLSSENNSSEGENLERDSQLINVLDKLILYMRIVHSVDFYNHCEYPYEDEMPNRCGIIHARGPPPNNKITKQDIEDYIKNFESKMSSFLSKSAKIDEDELKNLGCKDPEAEVEKFVQANTQELSKDKWLCPLSGKKFKGPEFIRKHIFNKHMEKVEEVRKEVEYFNNYLKDPKRPQLPEHPGNTKRNQSISDMGPQIPYRPGYPPPAYAAPYAAYAPPILAPPRPRGFGNRRELPAEHQRRIIGYHDLDAPQNFDFFD